MEKIIDCFHLLEVSAHLQPLTDSIDLLNEFSENVFSCRINDEDLDENAQRLYMYAIKDQAMFVLLDKCLPKIDVMKSVAEKVAQECDKRDVEFDLKNAYYVLLTSAHIAHKEEMLQKGGCWDDTHLLVVDDYVFNDYIVVKTNPHDKNHTAPLLYYVMRDVWETLDPQNYEYCINYDDDDVDDEENSFDDLFQDDEDECPQIVSEVNSLANSNIYEPRKSVWTDYIENDDSDFYDTSSTDMDGNYKRLQIAPHNILECIANAKSLLHNMIGISEMKDYITKMVDFAKYNEMLRERNVSTHNVTLHSVFTGNPGTGKTTLASILGSLLKDAGVLSKGHVVVCNRASFCSGRFWGDEEKAINQLMKIAKGGVLFIDEAYNLISADPRDPGFQVLPNLLTYLGDEQNRDICVVLAGYPKEMQKLMETNPGLDSRFPNKFVFRDYTMAELMKIAGGRLEKYGYKFTPAAKHAFENHLQNLFDNREVSTWGNARSVANLLEKIYVQHGLRVVNSKEQNIFKLKVKDIPEYQKPSNNKASRKIGFGR